MSTKKERIFLSAHSFFGFLHDITNNKQHIKNNQKKMHTLYFAESPCMHFLSIIIISLNRHIYYNIFIITRFFLIVNRKKERIFYPLSFINLGKIFLKRILSRSKCRSSFTTIFIKLANRINALVVKSEWRDLNPRPLPPQSNSDFFCI